MKSRCLALILGMVAALPGHAQDEELAVAPPELLADITANCQAWAKEEDVGDPELTPFVLDCVNEELNIQGFQPIQSLP